MGGKGGGDLYDHLMSNIKHPQLNNELNLKIMRYMVMALIVYGTHLVLIACFISQWKWTSWTTQCFKTNVRGIFWTFSFKTLVFPSPTGYML